MFVDAQDRDSVESGRIVGSDLQQWPDRLHGAPPGTELPADAVDRGVFSSDLCDRPSARARRQLGPWRRDPVVLFDEHRAGTGGF